MNVNFRFKTKEKLIEEGFLTPDIMNDGPMGQWNLWRDKDKKPLFFSSFQPFGKTVLFTKDSKDIKGIIRGKIVRDKVCVFHKTVVELGHFFEAE